MTVTAREVVDRVYKERESKRAPPVPDIQNALWNAGFSISEILKRAWWGRTAKTSNYPYGRDRDRVRAFRNCDRWLADQIDAKKQEVPV